MRQMFHVEGVPEGLEPGVEYMTRLMGARFVKCRDGEVDLVMHAKFMGPKTEPCAFTITIPEGSCQGSRKT